MKVALVGRPNVGKSSLFNLLSGRAHAITGATAGLTRDTQEATVVFEKQTYQFIDTAGLNKSGEELDLKMTSLSLNAAKEADLIGLIVDAREGLTPWDSAFAKELRKFGKPVFLIANKSETYSEETPVFFDFLKLGLGEPILISATHNKGIKTLMKKIASYARKIASQPTELKNEDAFRMTVIGRPNAGKSTFINAIIGKEKLLTGAIAGLTRDSIEVPFTWDGNECILIDTAGMRRRSHIKAESIEKQSVSQAIDAVNRSHVVIIMVDSLVGLNAQDLKIAAYAHEKGKPLLFAVNKIDALKDKNVELTEVKGRLSESFGQIKEVIVLPISALKKQGIQKIMSFSFKLFEKSGQRISTGKLNTWLDKALAKNPPPLSKLGRSMAIKYITQTGIHPPHFVMFVGGASTPPDSYQRYLMNSLKEEFDFGDIPVKFTIRKQKNPFKTETKKTSSKDQKKKRKNLKRM